MNNQQTQFSVRVSRVDFAIEALKALTHYSKLDKQYSTEADEYINDSSSKNTYRDFSSKAFELSERVKTIISMVSTSPDEFVNVTEDIYNLIYKCDS